MIWDYPPDEPLCSSAADPDLVRRVLVGSKLWFACGGVCSWDSSSDELRDNVDGVRHRGRKVSDRLAAANLVDQLLGDRLGCQPELVTQLAPAAVELADGEVGLVESRVAPHREAMDVFST